MRVLITGGSGFLGINLVRHLLNKNCEVTVLDIADFDYPDVQNKITFIKGDIRRPEDMDRACVGAEMIVHAAAALPLYTKEQIYSTDVDGTRRVLESAKRHKISRVIFISSTAVYGVPDHHPLFETDKLQGVGDYGNAKIMAEAACAEHRQNGLCIPILRPKSFIGPERLGVFAMLYDWAKDGRGFPMIGNGKNRYQLLDVEDLCSAIWLCLTLDKNITNDTFNIGAKVFTTMKNDFQTVLDRAGFHKKIIPFPATPVIIALKILEKLKLSPLYKWVYETAGKDSFVSIEKAEKILGYQPKFSNQDALIRNFDWYCLNLDKFKNQTGISHRVPWGQGLLGLVKKLF